MTVARRRPDAIAASLPSIPAIELPLPRPARALRGVAVPLGDAPAPESITPAGRLRRCTYRRIDRVRPLPGRFESSSYEVMCLYGGVEAAEPLGDVSSARPVCEACTAPGIFRPDED